MATNNKITSSVKKSKDEPRIMEFFDKALKAMDLTYNKAAQITGFSAQRISHWVCIDDCRLETMIEFFSLLGMELTCSYDISKLERKIIVTNNYKIEMSYKPGLYIPGKTTDNVETFNGHDKKGTLLHFLYTLINQNSYNLRNFCKIYDINYNQLRRCFVNNSVKISKIYQYASKTGTTVKWTLKPIKDINQKKTQETVPLINKNTEQQASVQ